MHDLEAIYNWRRLDDRITTSGQPSDAQLADIQSLGVRHIVNLGLHTHEKALPDEAASVSRLGMTYIHIPVDFRNPTNQDFDRFCAVMDQLKDVPVHIHRQLPGLCVHLSVAAGCAGHGRGDGARRDECNLAPTASGRGSSIVRPAMVMRRRSSNDDRHQRNGPRHLDGEPV